MLRHEIPPTLRTRWAFHELTRSSKMLHSLARCVHSFTQLPTYFPTWPRPPPMRELSVATRLLAPVLHDDPEALAAI